MILNYGFYFLLFLLVNSYKFAPINKYVYTIDINDYGINVIERSKINKKESKCLLFLTGGSGAIPPQIYSHFMDNLASVGLPVYTPHSNYKNKDLLLRPVNIEIDSDFYDKRCHEERMIALKAKFSQNSSLKNILLATRNAQLSQLERGSPLKSDDLLMAVREYLHNQEK